VAETGGSAGDTFVFPASYAQQRLWFLDQWEPGSAAYNVPVVVRLKGPLDLGALNQSLSTVVSRHEALRTHFELADGRPVQVITPLRSIRVTVTDLTAMPGADREAVALRLATAEAHEPFDLSRGPLLRAAAWALGVDDHVLLITFHHIVFDGWSMDVLISELSWCYNAVAAGKQPLLPPLAIQYADYTMWQRQWLQGGVLSDQLAYWRGQLSGDLPVLQLPSDRSRPALLTARGKSCSIQLPRTLVDRLLAIGRQERATLYMTLLAAFQALLFRYTDQDDVIVGAAIAGRNQVQLEGLIGFFANTLALRTNLAGDPTFRELLCRVREVTLGAYANQDVPFERLVEELRPPRHSSRTPLVQAMFVLQNAPQRPWDLDGLGVTPYALSFEATRFDLSVSLQEESEGLSGEFVYSTDLFDTETITRMVTHYRAVLESAGRDPDCRISALVLLPEAERRRVLVEWNDTARPYPRDRCAHELFEEQVARAPDGIAVVCGTDRATYAELNGRANHLAERLMARGVGPGARVGVCLARSIDVIAALLGVWKAGGAYVPLDASDPPERLAFMLSDAAVRVLVTDARFGGQRLSDDIIERLYLEDRREEAKCPPACNPANRVAADSLAYVMYTSGSTGEPKAVAVVHRGIVRLVKNSSVAVITPDDVLLQAAPVTFDASTFEIWGALLNGARLAQVPVARPSLQELGDVIEREGVTIAWFTSSLFNQMVEYEIDRLRRIRHVLAGGDVLSVPHVRRFFSAAASGTLTNGYGPTENTTFSCCHTMRDAAGIEAAVPIGRPISNTRVYVLDVHRRPQPIGVPGELYIGGDGLAQGYWNRPEQTAAAFVPSPFEDRPESRLYRTGDRVRYRGDGTLEFLGRVDHQVKLHGYRVELEEIDAVLMRHPSVREAAVVLREDVPGDKRLVAYVSVGGELDAPDLRVFLRRWLPEYMVPSSILLLDVLPKTSAGKVDRRMLPVPERTPQGPPISRGPRHPLDEQLLGIWRRVLRRDQIGVDDNFFELGGHSLLATQVVARIRAEVGRELPLRALFEAPTVAELAERLEPPVASDADEASASAARCVVPLQPHGAKTPFFCIHGIGGEVQSYQALARQVDPDRPFFGLRVPPLPVAGEFPTIEKLAATYVEEILRAVPHGPYLVGGHSSGATVAYEVAQQLHRMGKEVGAVVALDSQLPNNPGTLRLGPRALADYLRNLSWWVVDDFMQADRGEIRARIQSKVRVFTARVSRLPGMRWIGAEPVDIRDRLGMPTIPSEWGAFLEAHYESFMTYVPRPYPGRVALFKARTLPVTSLHESDLGWTRMAVGGVDVTVVPGSHETILRDPYVRALAEALRRRFDQIDERCADRDGQAGRR
jgi:aspartate racemase